MTEADTKTTNPSEPVKPEQSDLEGWCISNARNDDIVIQKLDEAYVFDSDGEALAFVERCAAAGSQYHIEALAYVNSCNQVGAL